MKIKICTTILIAMIIKKAMTNNIMELYKDYIFFYNNLGLNYKSFHSHQCFHFILQTSLSSSLFLQLQFV